MDGDVGDGRSQIRNLTVSYRFWPKKHRGFLPSFLPSSKGKGKEEKTRRVILLFFFLFFSSSLFTLRGEKFYFPYSLFFFSPLNASFQRGIQFTTRSIADSFLPLRKFEGARESGVERDTVDKIRRVCGAESLGTEGKVNRSVVMQLDVRE